MDDDTGRHRPERATGSTGQTRYIGRACVPADQRLILPTRTPWPPGNSARVTAPVPYSVAPVNASTDWRWFGC